ncbi:MAG: TonB-dependent receptor [Pseudomonadota bacterium]
MRLPSTSRLILAGLAGLAAALQGSAGHAQDSSQAITAGTAFNPQIALILTGDFYHDNARGAGSEIVGEAAGILHGMHFQEHGHAPENGFNLGESELVLAATVDPYFDGRFIAAFGGAGEVEIEEAWLQTRMLPAGLKVKAGRFLSDLGYQNNQHPHAWDFSDRNLAYTALLGAHGLQDSGLQLTWLAPAPFYLLLGAEALQGSGQKRFGTVIEADAAATVLDPALGSLPEHEDGPRLATAFAKFGPDLGDTHALQFGLSYARARQFQQVIDPDDAQPDDEYLLDGDQQLWGLDLVYKFDAAGAGGAGDFRLAAEYLRLEKDMTVTGAGAAVTALLPGAAVSGEQDGCYVQATYGIARRWQLGLRHDATGDRNELDTAGTIAALASSARTTLALSYLPSEFSRLRLQAAQGEIRDESGAAIELDQIWLTYTLSLGAHGAHTF